MRDAVVSPEGYVERCMAGPSHLKVQERRVEAHPEFSLVGARIERVDRPSAGLFALSLGTRDAHATLLVAAAASAPRPGFAIVRERPRGEPADGVVRGLREKLEGGVVDRAWHVRGALGLEVRRADAVWWVEASARGLSCALALEGATPSGDAVTRVAIEADDRFVRAHRRAIAEGARASADAAIRKLRARLVRRIDAIAGDLAAGLAADRRAADAALLVPAAAKAAPGATELVAVDWSSGEARELRLAVDPAKPPRAQLDATFRAAKRLRAGARVAEARAEEARRALAALAEVSVEVARATTVDEIRAALEASARRLPAGVRVELDRPREGPRAAATPTKRAPFRRYLAESGAVVLVGRDARGNDALTVATAKAGDLWLHAKGTTGAHVVVPGFYRGGGLDAGTLVDAATLAAHFSDERAEAIVEIAYCDRRYVRKRRGAAAGLVEVTREKVLALRLEPARLARLLATCDT